MSDSSAIGPSHTTLQVESSDEFLDLVAGAGRLDRLDVITSEDDLPSLQLPTEDKDVVDSACFTGVKSVLHATVKEEVRLNRKFLSDSLLVKVPLRCDLCPFRAVLGTVELAYPMDSEHFNDQVWVASAGKLKHIIGALLDFYRLCRESFSSPIKRPAKQLRMSVTPPISVKRKSIERAIVLVLEDFGPMYQNEG